jgi:hypothetical protein
VAIPKFMPARVAEKMRVTYPAHLLYNSSNHSDSTIRSKLPTHRTTSPYPPSNYLSHPLRLPQYLSSIHRPPATTFAAWPLYLSTY